MHAALPRHASIDYVLCEGIPRIWGIPADTSGSKGRTLAAAEHLRHKEQMSLAAFASSIMAMKRRNK
jgi:hypothetical protein